MCGEQCVMPPGEVLMPLLCVDNWATQLKVRYKYTLLGFRLTLVISFTRHQMIHVYF